MNTISNDKDTYYDNAVVGYSLQRVWLLHLLLLLGVHIIVKYKERNQLTAVLQGNFIRFWNHTSTSYCQASLMPFC